MLTNIGKDVLAALRPLFSRLLISAVMLILTGWVIFYAPSMVFLVLVECFIIGALKEFYDLVKKKEIEVNTYAGIIFACLIPVFMGLPAEPLVFAIGILCFFLIQFNSNHTRSSLINVSVMLFGVLYVGWLLSFFVKIRVLDDGSQWVFYTLIVTKACDTGAYVFGKKFGKHKLMEHISPNKTIEGAVAGLACSVGVSMLSIFYLSDVSLSLLFLLGLCIGILAELGDLAESLIKRDAGIKDSGTIPGLGGVLDIVDSLLFTAPFVYCFLMIRA